MTKDPAISILLPVYNGEKYLAETIQSLLDQTFGDFELLIINDGSTDDTEKVIGQFKDLRIHHVKNKENLKLIKTLNKGIDLAKGKYIARIDADDIALPNRLELQFNFMEQNPQVGVCGGAINIFSEINPQGVVNKMPDNSEEIKATMLFNSPIYHPTAFIRTAVLKKNNLYYDLDYPLAEDYALWVNIADLGFELANIDSVILNYRLHETNESKLHSETQLTTVRKIRQGVLNRLGINPSIEEEEIHRRVSTHEFGTGLTFTSLDKWLAKIQKANSVNKKYADKSLHKVLINKWFLALERDSSDKITKTAMTLNSRLLNLKDKLRSTTKLYL